MWLRVSRKERNARKIVSAHFCVIMCNEYFRSSVNIGPTAVGPVVPAPVPLTHYAKLDH